MIKMGTLYCGDCLDILKDVPDNSIDLVILDLPYGITKIGWDIKINLVELWKHLKRVSKERTAFFFFATFKFGAEILASNPDWFGFELIWDKKTLTNPYMARQHHNRTHENIYVFYKKLPYYYYKDYHEISKSGQLQIGDISSLYGYHKHQVYERNKYTPSLPTSVLEYKNPKFKGQHSTSKPIPLIEHIIKYYSKENDTVLDPTMGGGSIIKACLNLNRNFIGIEKNELFYDKLANELTQ